MSTFVIDQEMLAGLASMKEAYERVLPEIQAFEGPTRHPSVDVVRAATTALGTLPRLRPLRPAFEKLRPEELAAFDKLEDYIRAAYFARVEHSASVAPADEFEGLHEEVARLRRLFANDARALIGRGLLDKDALRDLRAGRGFRNRASDLSILVRVFQRNWTGIVGKSAVTEQEVTFAEQLSTLALHAVGERERSGVEIRESARLRANACTLFLDAYDTVRRTLEYVRVKEGDADEILPSLFASRGRKAKARPETEKPAESGAGAAVVASPVVANPVAAGDAATAGAVDAK